MHKQLNLWQRLRSNYWLALLFDAVMISLVFISINMWQARDLLPLGSDSQAPAFSLADRAGTYYQLDDYKGQRVIVYFFAPWCSICALSIHNLVDVAAEKDPELVVLAIGLDYQNAEEVWEFADKHKLQMPVLLGGAQQMFDWQINAFPTYYVINESGQIISRSIGYSAELGIRWRSRSR